MIDITKRNICDGCDVVYSENNPHDIYNLSIGDKHIALCNDCLKVLHDKIEKMINIEMGNSAICDHTWITTYTDIENRVEYMKCIKCGFQRAHMY